ncbi:hypothetical protein [Flavobacterium chungangense]|uniref:hypothetical protein n=1 Tax=Flavobacterium chungangense TaxID=554283 RepID=UPI0004DF3943|nr:hypothetical protein [Flavobacterium chungangense]
MFLFKKNNKQIYSGNYSIENFKLVKKLCLNNETISETELHYNFPFNFYHSIYLNRRQFFFELECVSLLKGKHELIADGSIYKIVMHKKKASIFKDQIQIGYFEENLFDYMGGHGIKIVLNNDVNEVLICSIVMALRCNFQNDYSSFSINLGNFGSEETKFDSSWRPI